MCVVVRVLSRRAAPKIDSLNAEVRARLPINRDRRIISRRGCNSNSTGRAMSTPPPCKTRAVAASSTAVRMCLQLRSSQGARLSSKEMFWAYAVFGRRSPK